MAVKGDGRCSLPPFTFLKIVEPGPRTVVDVSAHRNKCEPVSAWPHPAHTSWTSLQPIVCRTGP